MMRSAALVAAALRDVERKAALRAARGARRVALMVGIGITLFGALIFGSVGLVLVLAGPLGPGGAAFLVAALWLFMGIVALIALLLDLRRREPPMTPRIDPAEAMAALKADFGGASRSPLLAVAALVAGFIVAGRR
ncbi:MAG: hypothetical protein ACFBWO_18160 [Paracoccaceae bacterium]